MWPNFDYPTYMSYIEQNLVRALPDGWETDYPNLYHMVQKTGLAEYINVDGKTYGIPHATFCNFAEMEKIVNHVSIYYRADWLKELGMEPWGPSVSISEFAEYLRGMHCARFCRQRKYYWPHDRRIPPDLLCDDVHWRAVQRL